MKPGSFQGRAGQAWTIAKIELRRAFFAKRSFWVYGLALLPSVIFFGHGLEAKFRSDRLARRGVTAAALIDSVREGESPDEVMKRLGKPADERRFVRGRRVRRAGNAGTTTHVIEPTVDARIVRLNITRPSYSGEPVARIYEFEVYGPDGRENLALRGTATGSPPCTPDQGPERAVNGSVAAGRADAWCAEGWSLFLQVDLGAVRPVTRFVVKHASAGGENEESDTRDFNIQLSNDGKTFTTVASSSGAGFVDERIEYRELTYFDGRRDARFLFADGKLERTKHQPRAGLRRGPNGLRGDLPVLLLAARDLLRLSRHLHVSLPRRDEQPDAALLVSRAGAARSAARGQVCGGADCVCRDLRRRRPAHACGLALAARCRRSPGLLERRRHGTRVLVYGGGRARMRWLRQRLSRGRPVHAQSHHPGGRAARVGERQRHPSACAAEDEHPLLPAVAVSRPRADGG